MKWLNRICVLLALGFFLFGAGVFTYPYWHGYLIDRRIEQNAETFLSWAETDSKPLEPTESFVRQDRIPEPTQPESYTDLWQDMMAYNRGIYTEGQEGLNGKLAYETPEFRLRDYGLEDEIFAVITIPVLELEMPVFIGASSANMAAGAAILGQTSIPIGGSNTNCVIAGHRGWGGASYFRYIDELEAGDRIEITNLWETLVYEVRDIRIIWPNEVEAIHIQPDQELVTLLTCHPYGSGGKQRYLVICERTENELDSKKDDCGQTPGV